MTTIFYLIKWRHVSAVTTAIIRPMYNTD